MSSQNDENRLLFEAFIALLNTLQNGGVGESAAWLDMLPEGETDCDECKHSPDYSCDKLSIKCGSCSSRKTFCSRYMAFIKEKITERLCISEKTYRALLRRYIGSSKQAGEKLPAACLSSVVDPEDTLEDGMEVDQSPTNKTLLRSSASDTIVNMNYQQPLPHGAEQEEGELVEIPDDDDT
ncbi:hypothetical protein BDQ17DRAFT_1425512 [Cyathus striatus]|nr:hypothetical protein BDQ17DRAFT_1425512 [Cyathus striatus]